ncbi:MAG: sulfate adenylyltransferase, partial [Planctomycetota bacterium]
MDSHLIPPHGGELINLLVGDERAKELKAQSMGWTSWTLTPRQICDLELLANGGFSPLKGFLGPKDYQSVCEHMTLPDGTIWPIPIMLDIPEDLAKTLKKGKTLTLRDIEGVMLAALTVEELWRADFEKEAQQVFGTQNTEHPGVDYLINRTNPWYVSGKLECIRLPHHYDFVELRHAPKQLRQKFDDLGWHKIIAFQTRNPMHRAHQELTFRAARQEEANLLIHPVVGLTKPGDVDHFTRVRCYQSVLKHYPRNTVMLSLLPLAMRLGGPREAVWHAIIRKNYGCTGLIVGRDHAGPGADSKGNPFYGPYDAQNLLKEHEGSIGINMVPFKMMVYLPDQDTYKPVDEIPEGTITRSLSGTELRERLADGREIPSWFSFPEVVKELRRTHPPRSKQGF